ncbi:MAG: FliA/WhiG family RNA polymerase sigma factor [Syntrophaceticus sp.]|jgi:RNA polymerase sigma factor for flagellar operon FliA|nr:FliA/WhiG family RNA polymerase sigma factor [Eubacteriales bacterium]MDD3314367.1 FliA/WhiG family RNA polymerase sigma factor [Syntrophaceticus sp.]MDD4360271.1 FliA/WhiG family RNA polymerase sigma factor [Syntrophaceticus sp.]
MDAAKNEQLTDLWSKFLKKRDAESREQVVLSHLYLVKYIAGRLSIYFKNYYELEDLESAGIPGLISAVDHFNPEKKVKFETYATIRIRGAIYDWIRSLSWVPRSIYTEARKIEEALAQLEQRLGRVPDDFETAEYLNITVAEYHNLLEKVAHVAVISLDDPQHDTKESLDIAAADTGVDSVLNEIEAAEAKEALAEAITKLPERDQLVISLYYYEGLTLKEIGKVLGISESRVSQLHSRSLLRLRKLL